MAIWQCAIGLIPQEWTKQTGNGPEMLYDGEGYIDMSPAWKRYQPSADLIDMITQVLPPENSWSDEITIWGDPAKTDIQLSCQGDIVESVMVRIDTRDDILHTCSKIVELASRLSCCFFLPAARSIVMADVAALRHAVLSSSAARFAEAPREFIEHLRPD